MIKFLGNRIETPILNITNVYKSHVTISSESLKFYLKNQLNLVNTCVLLRIHHSVNTAIKILFLQNT